jgi:uncharacterized repeat protein (TIGR03803 family)
MKLLGRWACSFLIVLSLVAAASAQSSNANLSVLFSFPCDQSAVCPDGYFPISLIEGGDGNFYGVAAGGGTGMNAQGTVFKITPSGQLSVIYSFAERPDGSLPFGASPERVIQGTDGFLYGTTLLDGAFGFGTVFKLTPSGVITDLHDFCSTQFCADGAYPSVLTQALDGNFYGSTGPSGAPADILYRISPAGTFKVLHTFDTKGHPDGGGTFGFTPAPDGNFYGATVAGSQNTPFNSVFRFSPKTGAYKILHGFNWPNIAQSGLVMASNGELFGLQTNSNLYQISTKGAYHEIGPLSTTQYADGHILQASDGNLWGDFQGGDCGDQGMVFGATTAGSVLQNLTFNCNTDGQQLGSIFQAADGKFYGVTFGSGVATTDSITNGTIWSIDAGLPPPSPNVVNFFPTKGAVGTKVLLQGVHFVGTTAVTFNGVSATFSLLTANYISVTVPSGAKTGKIEVTNAGGTTTSTKPFAVQ